jgi:hypothetical protein
VYASKPVKAHVRDQADCATCPGPTQQFTQVHAKLPLPPPPDTAHTYVGSRHASACFSMPASALGCWGMPQLPNAHRQAGAVMGQIKHTTDNGKTNVTLRLLQLASTPRNSSSADNAAVPAHHTRLQHSAALRCTQHHALLHTTISAVRSLGKPPMWRVCLLLTAAAVAAVHCTTLICRHIGP